MATSYTSNLNLAKPAINDTDWGTPILSTINAIDVLSPIAAFAVLPKENPSSTLNIKVAPGSYIKANGLVGTYAGSTSFAITASSTLNVWLTDAGILTSGVSWPSVSHVRLAMVTTGASAITSIIDARIAITSSVPIGSAPVTSVAGKTGVVTLVEADVANLTTDLSSLTSNVALKAPIASPTFTGTVTIPTGLTGIIKATSGVLSVATSGTDYPSVPASSVLSTTQTLTASQDYIFASGTITLTLPTAATAKKSYYIKNIGTGTITINGTSSQLIDGITSFSLTTQYSSVIIVPDAANSRWFLF